MKRLRNIVYIYCYIISLSSIILNIFIFYIIFKFGGIILYETNQIISFIELFLFISAFIFGLILYIPKMLLDIIENKKILKKIKSYGEEYRE